MQDFLNIQEMEEFDQGQVISNEVESEFEIEDKAISISVLHSDPDSSFQSDLHQGIVRVFIPFGSQTPRSSTQFTYFYILKVNEALSSDQVLRFMLDHMQV